MKAAFAGVRGTRSGWLAVGKIDESTTASAREADETARREWAETVMRKCDLTARQWEAARAWDSGR